MSAVSELAKLRHEHAQVLARIKALEKERDEVVERAKKYATDWRTAVELDSDRIATLEAALRDEHAILEQEYGHGVANGYFPDIAPVLDRGRAALRGLEDKP